MLKFKKRVLQQFTRRTDVILTLCAIRIKVTEAKKKKK